MADFNTTRSQANQAYFGQEMSGERIKLTHISLQFITASNPKIGFSNPACFALLFINPIYRAVSLPSP
ncbi:hypothetical protein I7I48_02635 [Histoplasma ohiense]|nr:hypothetical protein I7I48_02635 [Histoplasma ohiense (nom. inval.)]